MDSRTRTILLWAGGAILAVAGIIILIVSFSGGSKDTPSEVEVIYTDAALTLEAQVLTLQAGMLSATPTLGSPTATLTQLPSPTLAQQTLPALVTSTVAAGGGATGCDNSVYISDVTIPDGTTVTPGQTFTKTWKVSNTGTCAWTAAYQIIFLYGDIMGGKATAIGKIVNPGESADVSVVLTAPSTAGNITGTWRLANANAQPFGTALTVVIKTGAVSATPTKTATGGAPAATATNTSAAAPTSTNTQTATNTPITPTTTSCPPGTDGTPCP